MPADKSGVKTTLAQAQPLKTGAAKVPIVSSAHLASGRSAELSEFEFGLIIAGNAFNRWIVRCIAASGIKDMTATDVLVLHHINHRAREKKLADIAFILNIEDAHIVNYSLKKLNAMGLVNTERSGKEVLYSTNQAGHDIDRSGWWQLTALIPVIGWIIMLYWLVQPPKEPNRFQPVAQQL